MNSWIAFKAQATTLIIQLGLNMAHKVHEQAFASNPEKGLTIKGYLDQAHTLLQLVARHGNNEIKEETPVLYAAGGPKPDKKV